MIYASNMTAEEYIHVNHGKIDPILLKLIDNLNDQIRKLEAEKDEIRSDLELSEEQIYYARQLIEELDEFAEVLSTKRQEEYKKIRENTSFEM